jgi:hypothetical protein
MANTRTTLLLWAPRVAGVAMSVFLALFALDAFDGRPLVAALPGFLIHLLPAVLVLCAVAIGWRFPLIGAAAFAGLAATYGVMVNGRLDWIALIAGPLLIVAALFAASWMFRRAHA